MIRAWTVIGLSLVMVLMTTAAGCGGEMPDGSVVTGDEYSAVRYGRFHPMVEDKLERVLSGYWHAQQPPGAVLVVQKGTTTRWQGAIGYSQLGAKVERIGIVGAKMMQPGQSMRMAGVVSLFNATLMLKLEEQGKLSLEHPISYYVAGVANGEQIPIFRLLNHTSGLSDYAWVVKGDYCDSTPLTADDLLQISNRLGPNSLPGAQYNPSAIDDVIAARIVSVIARRPYVDVLKETLLEPHGLRRTFVETGDEGNTTIPHGYGQLAGDELRDLTNAYHPSVFAHGNGIVSSASDVISFMNQLQRGEILSATSMHKMLEQHNVAVADTFLQRHGIASARTTAQAGLGLLIVQRGAETSYTALGADLRGIRTAVSYHPRDRITTVAFTNAYETPASVLDRAAWAAFARVDMKKIMRVIVGAEAVRDYYTSKKINELAYTH